MIFAMDDLLLRGMDRRWVAKNLDLKTWRGTNPRSWITVRSRRASSEMGCCCCCT